MAVNTVKRCAIKKRLKDFRKQWEKNIKLFSAKKVNDM
jgi:hypothetical protein